jgi:hypothetical protein
MSSCTATAIPDLHFHYDFLVSYRPTVARSAARGDDAPRPARGSVVIPFLFL